MKGFADLQIRKYLLFFKTRKPVLSPRFFLFEQTLAGLAISFIFSCKILYINAVLLT